MKKILLSVVCLVMVGMQSVNAQVGIVALHHEGHVTVFGEDKIASAIEAAVAGDTIYMSEGHFFVNVGDPQHNAYMTFMAGDQQVVRVKTNVKNGRKLAIVKDSYGNSIPGYLFSSYEEIYVIDMRYFDLNLVNFVKEQEITDLLFTMVAYSALGENAGKLEILRTQ